MFVSNKIIFFSVISFVISCGRSTEYKLTKEQEDSIKVRNNFSELTLFEYKGFGTKEQIKYKGKKDSLEYIVKPQVPGLLVMEAAYIAMKRIYDGTRHKQPLKYGYDSYNKTLYIEYRDCPNVFELENDPSLWNDELARKVKDYKKKFKDLEITDINENKNDNIIYCESGYEDQFYIIDPGILQKKDFFATTRAFLRYFYWLEKDLTKSSEGLNIMSKRIWGDL